MKCFAIVTVKKKNIYIYCFYSFLNIPVERTIVVGLYIRMDHGPRFFDLDQKRRTCVYRTPCSSQHDVIRCLCSPGGQQEGLLEDRLAYNVVNICSVITVQRKILRVCYLESVVFTLIILEYTFFPDLECSKRVYLYLVVVILQNWYTIVFGCLLTFYIVKL